MRLPDYCGPRIFLVVASGMTMEAGAPIKLLTECHYPLLLPNLPSGGAGHAGLGLHSIIRSLTQHGAETPDTSQSVLFQTSFQSLRCKDLFESGTSPDRLL
jgi:hypothetical protein